MNTSTESGSDGPSVSDFDALVDRHKEQVYYTALDLTGSHHDAEDLSQEVFIKAYRFLDRFRGESKLSTWLYRICVNTYLNKRRKKSVRHMHLTDTLDRTHEHTGAETRPSRHAERAQMQDDIEASLDVLSPRERTAFVLKHYNDLKIREVAESMEVATGTVKSLLYRATRKLRDELSFYRDDL